MAIQVQSVSTSGAVQTTAGASFDHTTTGKDRFLFVGVGSASDNPALSITFAGIPLTLLRGESATGADSQIWFLKKPPIGTYPVTLVMSGTISWVAGAITLTGVDPYRPIAKHDGTTIISGNISLTIEGTPEQGFMVGTAVQSGGLGLVIGLGTQQWLTTTYGGSTTGPLTNSLVGGTLSWTNTGGAGAALSAVVLRPAPYSSTRRYFSVEPTPGTVALSGTITASTTETDIVAGGKTIILTLTGNTWIGTASFDAQRQAIINGLDSAQSEGTGWDAVVKAGQGVAGVVRTSDTVVTITLDAFASYDITAQETITATVPASALAIGGSVVATPTFTVDIAGAAGVAGIDWPIFTGKKFRAPLFT